MLYKSKHGEQQEVLVTFPQEGHLLEQQEDTQNENSLSLPVKPMLLSSEKEENIHQRVPLFITVLSEVVELVSQCGVAQVED